MMAPKEEQNQSGKIKYRDLQKIVREIKKTVKNGPRLSAKGDELIDFIERSLDISIDEHLQSLSIEDLLDMCSKQSSLECIDKNLLKRELEAQITEKIKGDFKNKYRPSPVKTEKTPKACEVDPITTHCRQSTGGARTHNDPSCERQTVGQGYRCRHRRGARKTINKDEFPLFFTSDETGKAVNIEGVNAPLAGTANFPFPQTSSFSYRPQPPGGRRRLFGSSPSITVDENENMKFPSYLIKSELEKTVQEVPSNTAPRQGTVGNRIAMFEGKATEVPVEEKKGMWRTLGTLGKNVVALIGGGSRGS